MPPIQSSNTSQLPAALQQAYRAALYQVDAEGAVSQTLRVGERSDWLHQQLSQRSTPAACYLTACNPWGAVLSDAANAERMTALRQALDSNGWQYLNGCGQDAASQWREDSLLIWGMDAATALLWGQQWEQNAVLWSAADAVPQLLWLR